MAEEKTTPAKGAAKTHYSLFDKDDQGILSPLGEVVASNPQAAVRQWIGTGDAARPHRQFTVVPTRNISEVKVRTETETKLVFE